MSDIEKIFLTTTPSVAVGFIILSLLARVLKRLHPTIGLVSVASFLIGTSLLIIVFVVAQISKPH